MPQFPVHDLDTAPPASRDTLALLQKRFGKVLNVHGAMAHQPMVLAAYQGQQDALRTRGSFDEATRQAIALTVAAVNGSPGGPRATSPPSGLPASSGTGRCCCTRRSHR